ncbi:hydroxymethylbilane synthase [Streptomyces beigongshangae]|uniref:hydroxymethylbilane synthase n=1 Tax=Streptomyces beigongshangae TaxID=2841597 RepID=UPI0021A346E0|nr:hydroxymethylbilane synthase [Streptomyces sp. REN17]
MGTRRSALALAQSSAFAQALGRATGAVSETVGVTTEGDTSTAAVTAMGSTGVFVQAVRAALLAKEIDFAVHSYKDLPTAPPDGIVIAAVPAREDPRDALVTGDGSSLARLPAGARIGTGSPRRAGQLAALRPDLEVVPLRGNVDTRLGKVRNGELDGVVLAAAGLARLGRLDEAAELFAPDRFVPAPAQGALAVECRSADTELARLLGTLDDPACRAAVEAERAVLAELDAGCSAPVGAHARLTGPADRRSLVLCAVIAPVAGRRRTFRTGTAPAEPYGAALAGRGLAVALLRDHASGCRVSEGEHASEEEQSSEEEHGEGRTAANGRVRAAGPAGPAGPEGPAGHEDGEAKR